MNTESATTEAINDLINPRLVNFRERAAADIERQVLQTSAASSLDEICSALDATEWLLSRAKTIDRLIREIVIQWIDRNGEFDIGDIHYWVGFATAVKCLNVPQTGLAVLEAAGGEINKLFGALVAQPYKHATVRNLIRKALYNRLFTTQKTAKLNNGAPQRILRHADKRFLPLSPSE